MDFGDEEFELSEGDKKKSDAKYELDVSIMLRDQKLNYNLWDDAEIFELNSYLDQFHSMKEQYKDNKNFNNNWCNVDKACKYFWDEIRPKWVVTDETMPTKQAIRQGKAIPVNRSMFDNSNLVSDFCYRVQDIEER